MSATVEKAVVGLAKATVKKGSAKKAPTPIPTRAKKEGLRTPQVRILAYLAKTTSGAGRKEIAEKAPVDRAWCTEYLGSFDPAIREKNDDKPGGFPSLLRLGFVGVEGVRGSAIYTITAKGKEALKAMTPAPQKEGEKATKKAPVKK